MTIRCSIYERIPCQGLAQLRMIYPMDILYYLSRMAGCELGKEINENLPLNQSSRVISYIKGPQDYFHTWQSFLRSLPTSIMLEEGASSVLPSYKPENCKGTFWWHVLRIRLPFLEGDTKSQLQVRSYWHNKWASTLLNQPGWELH